MKNILLFSLAFIISLGSLQAQYSKESTRNLLKKPIVKKLETKEKQPILEKYLDKRLKQFLQSKEYKSANNTQLHRIDIGKSANAHSVIYSQQRPLFYNPIDQSMHFSFPADPESYPDANSSGSVVTAYAENTASSWDNERYDLWEDNLIINNANYINNPSCVAINPDESEDIEEYYTIISGTDSLNGSWLNTAFISSKINNDNYSESIQPMESENDIARSNMILVDDEVYVFGQDYENILDYGVNQTLKHYRGTTSDVSQGFDWDINSVSPDWLIDPDEGFAYALYDTWSAWSNDGSIGYMWMVGVTNDSYGYGVFQPQVYYTTDKGDTWNYIELNFEDNYILQSYLQAWEDENGNPMSVRPSFLTADQTYPGAVDIQGTLHLFSNVYGSTKGDVLNPDDANWIDPEAKGGHIFDFMISPYGLEIVEFVSEINSKVSTNMFGDLGFDHRLQVAKNQDEWIVLAVWLDDIWSESDSLVSPDVFAWNICNGFLTVDVENLTEDYLYEGFNFYPSLPSIISNNWNIFGLNIPLTVSVSPNEFVNGTPEDPISHFYVDGLDIQIHGMCYESIEENKSIDNLIEISQNTPNPFNKNTIIEITSSIKDHQRISLQISNIMGNIILNHDEGLIYNYKEIEISAEKLEKGVYFYTICVGEECFTRKMIVN